MIEVDNLSIKAGDFRLDGISFEIPEGDYGVLMGRTGCGKTTILEAICGLKEVTDGTIKLNGADMTLMPPSRRGIGFVPQDGTLFSTMTVFQHLAFGPKVHGWAKQDIVARVHELLAALSIEHLVDRKPYGLSGGERQRVALGRALAVRPGVICLDEPLSALDDDTHAEMSLLIKQLVTEHGITVLHITHSRIEAEAVADRVFFLEKGKLRLET